MKRLICEMCGGSDLVKQDGVFVCQNCGTKYSVEEAKNMMVEGAVTVEGTVAVEGTVKVDKSEELKNLYVLARRAKEADNSENACKYYSEIILKDPDNWEANFYLVYYKAASCKKGQIGNEAYNVSNCLKSTIRLLVENLGTGDQAKGFIDGIRKDLADIAGPMIHGAMDVHEYGYIGQILRMQEMLGNCLKEYPELHTQAVEAWKQLIDTYVEYACFGDPKLDYVDMYGYTPESAVQAIYELDPSYEDPFGVAKKLRRNETFITCPKCGATMRERESKCPQCGTPKEEIQRLIAEKEAAEAAERERLRKEREAKEAEEARIRAEKRAEWWAANKKKVGIAFLVIIAIIGILVTIIKVSNAVAKNIDKGTVQQNEKIDYSSVGRRADASYENIQSVLISLSANGSKSGNPYRLASLFTETVNPYVKEGNSKNSQDIPEAMRQFLERYDYYEVSSPNDLNVQSRGSGYIATYNIIVEWNSERTGHKRACIQKTAYFNNECKITGFIDQELWRESVSQNSGIRNNSTPSLILDMIGTIGTSQGTLFFNETENRGNYSYSLSNATVKRNLVLDKHVEEKLLLNSYDLSGKYIGKFDGTIKSKGNQISYVGIFTNYKGVSVDFKLHQKGQENHYVNGHRAVDMGLSVRWADCNVGASASDDSGNYYAWGETTTKASYNRQTYKFYSNSTWVLKYCTMSDYGNVDNKLVLDSQNDAASANWGELWSTPTKEQWEELANSSKCTWEWMTTMRVPGYRVTSKITGNSIFIPTTGYLTPAGYQHGEMGLYWTSSLYPNIWKKSYGAAYRFDMRQTSFATGSDSRHNGRAIRAVCK